MNDLIEWFDDEVKKISSAEPINSDPVKLTNQIAEQKVCLLHILIQSNLYKTYLLPLGPTFMVRKDRYSVYTRFCFIQGLV
jgi:hypothetical protein